MKRLLDDLAVPEAYRATDQPTPPTPTNPPEQPTSRVSAPAKAKMGRPSTFNQDVADELCRRLAQGELACEVAEDPGMPSVPAIHSWREKHPHFAEAYSRAREEQAHAVAERGVAGLRSATQENWQVKRAQFDGEKWLASKLAPKVYGDRIEQHVTGEVVHMTEDQRRARIQALEARRLGREAAVGAVIEGVVVPPVSTD